LGRRRACRFISHRPPFNGWRIQKANWGRGYQRLAALPLALAAPIGTRELMRQFEPEDPFGGSTLQSYTRHTTSELRYLNGEVVSEGRRVDRLTPINALLLEYGERVFATRRFMGCAELATLARSVPPR
jgi:hypothetical protein